MAAYNFQRQFVEPIKTRRKRHTIRNRGKRHHAKPGEPVQLYWGQRTIHCEKIIADPTCLWVRPISFFVGPDRLGPIFFLDELPDDVSPAADYDEGHVGNDCSPLNIWDSVEDFAREDGFESMRDMHRFWLQFHGQGVFQHAVNVRWGWV